jgi:hypothetical protein
MRRLATTLMTFVLILAVAGPAAAAGTAGRGFLPPNARVHGHTLTELSVAWNLWGFGGAEDVNPLVNPRCEQSSLDPRIWFTPVSFGVDEELDCDIPVGAFLVVTPGGYFCDPVEAGGSTEAELRACAVAGFEFLSYVEVVLDGRSATNLDRYIVTSPRIGLPGPNLLSDEPTFVVDKSYFLVVHPLSRGQHTVRAYDEAEEFDFKAGFTFHITVG